MRLVICGIATVVLAGCGASRGPATPYVSRRCPLPSAATPYTVVARASGVIVDPYALRATVDLVLSHLSDRITRPGNAYVDTATLTLDHKHRHFRRDWRPARDHRAKVSFSVNPDGSYSAPRIEGSTDKSFARYVSATFADVQMDRHRWRPHADSAARTFALAGDRRVEVTLHFGETPLSDEIAFAEFAIHEAAANPLGAAVRLKYPEQLLQVGMEGDVLAQFVIDTAGRMLERSLRFVRSNHWLFERAVIDVLPTIRFRPATIDCRPVPQLVQQPYLFKIQQSTSGQIRRRAGSP